MVEVCAEQWTDCEIERLAHKLPGFAKNGFGGVLVEGWNDEPAFIDWCARFAEGPAFSDALATPDWAVYRLQNSRDRLSA